MKSNLEIDFSTVSSDFMKTVTSTAKPTTINLTSDSSSVSVLEVQKPISSKKRTGDKHEAVNQMHCRVMKRARKNLTTAIEDRLKFDSPEKKNIRNSPRKLYKCLKTQRKHRNTSIT